jgi:transposase-like protein
MVDESQLSIVVPADTTEEEGRRESAEPTADTAAPGRAPRHRLTPDQEREVARLYAETATPTSEVRQRFGITESSLYRILQRQGVALRGRAPSAKEPVARRGRAAMTRRARPGQRQRAAARSPAALAPATAVSPAAGAPQAFRVQFQGQAIVEARDIRDALRQAESFGAIEVTAITREA